MSARSRKRIVEEFNRKAKDLERKAKIRKGEKAEETDYQRELRFTQLRQARQKERDENPERYPPRHNWWKNYEDRCCHYFPKDIPTEEELEFYKKVATDYHEKKIAYHFHTYDMFLAYNSWHLEELQRWQDFVDFGHIHDLNETLEQWKAHTTDEHHLHANEPMPPVPCGWSPDYRMGDVIKSHAEHMKRLVAEDKSPEREEDED